jgi:hypothetical protein
MPHRNQRTLPARHVRRLHVRAAADEDASRAATLLSDALRTATLPGADEGRLVIIRRLDLGRISASVPATTLALQIERVTSELLSHAVIYSDRAAETAAAVTFPSRSAAMVALARVYARRARAGEWYWPIVVPGWRTANRAQRWLLLLDAAQTLPEALLVAAAIVDQAIAAGADHELLSAIPGGRGDVWLGPASVHESSQDSCSRTPLCLPHAALIEQWQRRWGRGDDRLVWLATVAAVLEQPALVASPRLRSIALEALHRIDQGALTSNATHVDSAWRRQATTAASVDAVTGPDPMPRDSGPTAAARPEEIDVVPDERGDWLAGAHTDRAGLFFLIPILQRLGFAHYVSSRPYLLSIAFPSRLLSFMGQRVGLTEDDPIAASLNWADPCTSSPAFVIGDMPDRMREALLTPTPRVALDSSSVAWLTAVRRWCRRHARIGLHSLIRRPGRVANTRTHTDICLPVSKVDLRVRRLALDTDPGWVPWLGRTITFHYLRGDERAR